MPPHGVLWMALKLSRFTARPSGVCSKDEVKLKDILNFVCCIFDVRVSTVMEQ